MAAKVIIALVVVVQVFASDDVIKEVNSVCMASSGVELSVVMDAMSGNVPESNEFKQYLFCFFTKFNFLNGNSVDFANVEAHIDYLKFPHVPDNKVALEKCKAQDLTGPTAADTALNAFTCAVRG